VSASDVSVTHTAAAAGTCTLPNGSVVPCSDIVVKIAVPYGTNHLAVAQKLSANLGVIGCGLAGAHTGARCAIAPSKVATSALGVTVLPAVQGGTAISISAPSFATATSNGDPHVHRADGWKTDIRGRHGAILNYLSAPNISLTVLMTNSTFFQKHGAQKVHGSHITAAYITLRHNQTGTLITAALTAAKTPWFAPITYVSVGGAKPVKVSTDKLRSLVNGGINITAATRSSVEVSTKDYYVALTRRNLYKPMPGTKPNFVDVSIRRLSTDGRQPIHGIIGQSFDINHRIHANGKLDDYTAAEVTTTAQGEGAIEGVISDYEMRSAFDTRFKFSRFDDVAAMGARLPMNATIVAPLVVAFTETDEALGA